MSLAPLRTAAVTLAAVLLLAGCSTAAPAPTTTPTSAASATPTPTAAPEPEETPEPFAGGDFTCSSILPPATLAVFESKKAEGFTLQKDFVDRVRNLGGSIAAFVDYGGILCQWAYSGAQRTVNYGYSAITADDAATQQQVLVDQGYTVTQDDSGTRVENADKADFPDSYLFIDGYWFYASDRELLDVITDNLFANP